MRKENWNIFKGFFYAILVFFVVFAVAYFVSENGINKIVSRFKQSQRTEEPVKRYLFDQKGRSAENPSMNSVNRAKGIERCKKWLEQIRNDPSSYNLYIQFISFESSSFGISLEEIGTSEQELEELKSKSKKVVPKKGAREV